MGSPCPKLVYGTHVAPTANLAEGQHPHSKNLRPCKGILDQLTDAKLIKRYRLDRGWILFVISRLP